MVRPLAVAFDFAEDFKDFQLALYYEERTFPPRPMDATYLDLPVYSMDRSLQGFSEAFAQSYCYKHEVQED